MLIKCPECGKEISDKANDCPNCGCPIQQENNEEYNSNISKGILALVLSIIGIILAFVINQGIGLIFPTMLYVFSIIAGKKCLNRFATIGLIVSVIGLVLIAFEIFKTFLF